MAEDWYARRHELEPGMVFDSLAGIVRLDRSVSGDATRWHVETGRHSYTSGKWGWYCEDATVEPGDLIKRLPDDYKGEA